FEHSQPVGPLLERAATAGLDLAAVEALLRAGRATYPPPPWRCGEITDRIALPCDHVDHATGFLLYLPTAYDPAVAWPLAVIGHGGSVGRNLDFAEWA